MKAEVQVEGETRSFTRPDRDDPAVEVHFCPSCGSTTHFVLTERLAHLDRVGVNIRLFDWPDLAGVEARFPDGSGWAGVSAYGYRREPVTIGPEAIP